MTPAQADLVDETAAMLSRSLEHRQWCGCGRSGSSLMRWQPGSGVYRPSDFDTPPHTPRRTP